jgi:hypothetical protein
MFAARAFRIGDRIRRVNVVREVTTAVPLRPELGERVDHCAYPDAKVVLIGFPDRHLNHGCDPNAYEVYDVRLRTSWLGATSGSERQSRETTTSTLQKVLRGCVSEGLAGVEVWWSEVSFYCHQSGNASTARC